jgi:hypothetical protein
MHRIASLSVDDVDDLADAALDFTQQDQLERCLSGYQQAFESLPQLAATSI